MLQLGPVMLDLEGLILSETERALLQHPQVGGVILFSRNYKNLQQLSQLVADIRSCRNPILIAVDQEGGRVQRFREGFTALPPAALFGEIYQRDAKQALQLAESTAWLMASELLAVGIDFSFASDVDSIVALSKSFMQGMHRAGMAAVGKHFPGHGSVAADSHTDIPIDTRSFAAIQQLDLQPFKQLINDGIDGLMPAHIIYSEVDQLPAGFSQYWLQDILREQLYFNGCIFSDDLSMAGANGIGTYPQRAQRALSAGCDMVLVCNNRQAAVTVLDALSDYHNHVAEQRILKMSGKAQLNHQQLIESVAWQQAVQQLNEVMNDHAVL